MEFFAISFYRAGAEKRTRTSTELPPLAPEASASTKFRHLGIGPARVGCTGVGDGPFYRTPAPCVKVPETSPKPVDIVFIRGLKAKATIGVFDWERQIRQNLVLDLELKADAAAAAKTDQLEDAVDYKEISRRVVELVEESEHHLVETLAEEVAKMVRKEFKIGWLRLRIAKPFAVRAAQDVGVLIERGK